MKRHWWSRVKALSVRSAADAEMPKTGESTVLSQQLIN